MTATKSKTATHFSKEFEMTAQRRKEISNAIMSQEQKRIRAENETRILAPILKKIEAILGQGDLKKLAKLRDALKAKIKAD